MPDAQLLARLHHDGRVVLRLLRPEFDSGLCGEGRLGEISLSSPDEAAAGAGVCLRGFGLA